MEVAHLRDGKIVEYHMYWDRMATARQLGLLPEPDIN
jgi:ketosteroid isomerase-like protein